MKHHELLDKIYWYWRRDNSGADGLQPMVDYRRALLEVVELHKPRSQGDACIHCSKRGIWIAYPCPTINAIEGALV